jgi:replicative DNA helicase
MVKTVAGWRRMGDLRVGDEVASVDGRRSVLSGVFPQGPRQVYRVTFSDGRSAECCAEHLWRVYYRGWPEPRTLRTDKVATMLGVKRYRQRLWIDMPSGDDGHSDALPLDPWLLGALLGDGTLSGSALRFSTADAEMLERLIERVGDGFEAHPAGGYDWRIVQAGGAHRRGVSGVAPNPIMEALRALGLWDIRSEKKFIPPLYLYAGRDARRAVLCGLMDTDGWVERWGSTRFCSTSERLAQDVAGLVRSLGGWCSVRSRQTTYRYRGETKAGRTAFVCNIHHPDPKSLFEFSVKRDRALIAPRRERRPVFMSVEPTRVTATQCIAVTHPSHLYVTDGYVVTHNTAFALCIAQYVGITLRGKVLVMSLEMSAQQLVQRMLSSEGKVDSLAVRTGRLQPADWHRLTAAAGRLSEAPIFIDDSPGLTVLDVRAKSRRMKAEHGLDLVIIDYLQLMRGRASLDNRQQEISEISRSLKALAKELNVPVVALSQLSRAIETRGDSTPRLSDLRECLTGDTLVCLADGRRVPIHALDGTAPEVLSMSSVGTIVPAKSERVWLVGKREVVSVRTASGRTIRTTPEHRLFSGSGWKTVAELSVGDRLAIARRVPEPMVPDRWPDLQVALLGQLIGDGSYLKGQPLRYTTSSEANSTIVAKAAGQEFGCNVKRYAGRRSWHQLLISGNGDRWHSRGVAAWLRRLGVFGQRSYEKRVPEAAFQLSDEQVALLLRHLWSTDGTIAVRKGGRGSDGVSYSTTSRGLAGDVAALLLRLGIVARISQAKKAAYRPSFFVSISGAEQQRRFLRVVGAFGPRKPQASNLERHLLDRRSNTNVDTLPIETFVHVKELMRSQGVSQRRMAALRGTAYGGAAHFKFAPSRAVVRDYAEILDDEALRAAAASDLFWDRVVAIEPAGEEAVFDLTVPGLASWLADGIVSHNSGALEQDADVIMFLHRPSFYSKDPAEETRKTAEVHIGKQRNGPTGKIEVSFLSQYARFENLARADRQYQPF